MKIFELALFLSITVLMSMGYLEFAKADSGQRLALVIGNADYRDLPLKNPLNDANDIANALRDAGFVVELVPNANQREMESAISNFGRKLERGGVGLFYYSGHGAQSKEENYMIPLSPTIKREKDLRYKAVSVGQVLDEMGNADNGMNIVILDACRDNPLVRSFRSSNRGLARVDGPTGTLIAYSTSPGDVAEDGLGRNGTYTKHLLKAIRSPGLPLEGVFKKVLQGVKQETNGKQVPWTSSSFSGNFFSTQVQQTTKM